MSPRFPLVYQGVRELPLRPTASKVASFGACGVFVD